MRSVVGHSEDPDTTEATQEVISQCKKNLGSEKPIGAMVFMSPKHDAAKVLQVISNKFQDLPIFGCTSSAEMSSEMGFTEGGLVLSILQSNKVTMDCHKVEDVSKKNSEQIKDEIKKFVSNKKPKLAIVFSSVTLPPGGTTVTSYVKEAVGNDCLVLGGGASDHWEFVNTRQFYMNEVSSDSMVVGYFSGPLKIAFGIETGWIPFTKRSLASDCRQNTLHNVDNDTALSYYEHYTGGNPSLAFPLAVFTNSDENFYLRSPIIGNKDDGSIFCADFIPPGAQVCIAKATPEEILVASKKSIDLALTNYGEKKPDFVLVVSCTCRQNVLGTQTQEEAQIIGKILKEKGLPFFGPYCYGQTAPYLAPDSSSMHHNQAMLCIAIGE